MRKNNLLAFNWLVLGLLMLITLSSCGYDSNKVVSAEPSPEAERYRKTLLVIGDDRSGSTSDIRKLTEADYKDIFTAINNRGGGTLAVCLIGNPLPQSREPYILQLEPLHNTETYNPNDTQQTLTEKSKKKLRNDKIIASNKASRENNNNKIDDFISGSIIPNIINYKPSGVDHTDIDNAISRINTLIQEPGYRDYDEIIVTLVSDGKNQPGNTEKPIASLLELSKAKVYLVGWDTPTNCFGSSTVEKFSVKDGMMNVIKNLK